MKLKKMVYGSEIIRRPSLKRLWSCIDIIYTWRTESQEDRVTGGRGDASVSRAWAD